MIKVFLALIVLLIPTTVIASEGPNGSSTHSSEQENRTMITGEPETNLEQNETLTENQSENRKLQVGDQGQEKEASEASSTPRSFNRSQTAEEHMSTVAQYVQQLLSDSDRMGGIGQQVKVITKNQNQAQLQIEDQYNQMANRPRLLKALIGPDYSAMKSLEQQIFQSQIRIHKLQQIQTQLSSPSDITTVQSAIRALVQQNASLQTSISNQQQTFSLLGWLFSRFD